MATYQQAHSAIAEHVSLRWRITALDRCSAFLDKGETAAAIAAYLVAKRGPFDDEQLRQAVDQIGLLLADPASAAMQ